MPDIEQVIVFRYCTRMYANLCRRYAAWAAKKLANCARESRRWEENLNWQIQGCTIVASHLDNLHATVGKPLHRDKSKWNVYNFRSRSVSSQTAELPYSASNVPRKRKCKRGGKMVRARALRQHTAIENLLTDTTQQPLEFYYHGSWHKPRLSRLWLRLMFCWGSLLVVPPLPHCLQRLAATKRIA